MGVAPQLLLRRVAPAEHIELVWRQPPVGEVATRTAAMTAQNDDRLVVAALVSGLEYLATPPITADTPLGRRKPPSAEDDQRRWVALGLCRPLLQAMDKVIARSESVAKIEMLRRTEVAAAERVFLRNVQEARHRLIRYYLLRLYELPATLRTADELERLGTEAANSNFLDTARLGLLSATDHVERTGGSEDGRLAYVCLSHGIVCEAAGRSKDAETAYLQGCSDYVDEGRHRKIKADMWGRLASLYHSQRGKPHFRTAQDIKECLEQAKTAGLPSHPLFVEYKVVEVC